MTNSLLAVHMVGFLRSFFIVLESGAFVKARVHGQSGAAWQEVADRFWKRIPPPRLDLVTLMCLILGNRKAQMIPTYKLEGEVVRLRIINIIIPALLCCGFKIKTRIFLEFSLPPSHSCTRNS